jgi:N-acetylglutamate synthase-like GNAT family acetyltransferase
VIRKALAADFEDIYRIINDAAIAYKGVIPDDRWHDPYMTRDELRDQIEGGVGFSCYCQDNEVYGVMGIQDKGDVYLIRHAYVLTIKRNQGIGSQLLSKLIVNSERPILIGTWKDATWAINFYIKHGFTVVSDDEKEILLRKYWKIPERQVETSVVLSDSKFELEKNKLLAVAYSKEIEKPNKSLKPTP